MGMAELGGKHGRSQTHLEAGPKAPKDSKVHTWRAEAEKARRWIRAAANMLTGSVVMRPRKGPRGSGGVGIGDGGCSLEEREVLKVEGED